MKDIVGYICATVLGVALLMVDGDVAFMYCVTVGGAMVGVIFGNRTGKINAIENISKDIERNPEKWLGAIKQLRKEEAQTIKKTGEGPAGRRVPK